MQSFVISKQRIHGFDILYESIPSAITVTFGIWVRNGSRYETNKEIGYAHFLEHILFKAMPGAGPKAVAKKIDQLGGYVNAYTSKEHTVFFGTFTPDLLARGIRLLLGIVFFPHFLPREISREISVVLEEIKMYQDSPDDFLIDFLFEKLFAGSGLAHSELGNMESVSSIAEDKLLAYYHKVIHSGNILFSMVGPMEQNPSMDILEKELVKILPYINTSSGVRKKTPGKKNKSNKSITVHYTTEHHERDLEQMHFVFSFPGFPYGTKESLHLDLFNIIVGGNQSSMLFQEIREKRGLCYHISSSSLRFSDVGVWNIAGATDFARFYDLQNKTMTLLKQLMSKGLRPNELKAAKNFMKINLMMSLESTENRMNRNARQYLINNKIFSIQDMVQKIERIEMTDLFQVLDGLFSKQQYAVTTIGKKIN